MCAICFFTARPFWGRQVVHWAMFWSGENNFRCVEVLFLHCWSCWASTFRILPWKLRKNRGLKSSFVCMRGVRRQKLLTGWEQCMARTVWVPLLCSDGIRSCVKGVAWRTGHTLINPGRWQMPRFVKSPVFWTPTADPVLPPWHAEPTFQLVLCTRFCTRSCTWEKLLPSGSHIFWMMHRRHGGWNALDKHCRWWEDEQGPHTSSVVMKVGSDAGIRRTKGLQCSGSNQVKVDPRKSVFHAQPSKSCSSSSLITLVWFTENSSRTG